MGLGLASGFGRVGVEIGIRVGNVKVEVAVLNVGVIVILNLAL